MLEYIKKNKIQLALLLVFTIILLVNLFLGVFIKPVNSFDEARHGVNAYEMLKNKEFIVTTYGYEIDYWNTKPPLSIWVTMFSMFIFGTNIIAIRLPSVIFFLITLSIIIRYSFKKEGNKAIWVYITIICSTMFTDYHNATSGDADSLFIMFYVISMLTLIKSINNKKYYYLLSILFSLSFLTKSWHSFIIPISVLVYLIISKEILRIKIKDYLKLFLPAILIIGVWGILRYQKDGILFFYEMINYDLLKRTTEVIEGHLGEWDYYISNIVVLMPIIPFILFINIYNFIKKVINNKCKIKIFIKIDKEKLIIYIMAFLPIVIYSFSKSKRIWYIYPSIFPLAIILSQCIDLFIKECSTKASKYIMSTITLIVLVAFKIFSMNIFYNINIVDDPVENNIIAQADNEDIKGKNIYVKYTSLIKESDRYGIIKFNQNHLLLSELYLDSIYKKGEIDDFVKDKEALLIVDEEYLNEISTKCKFEVLSESKGVYLIEKKGVIE